MRLIGKPILQRTLALYPAARPWVTSWVAEIADAQWKQPADVRAQFPRVRERPSGAFAFPVADTGSALVLAIAFPAGVALIETLISRDDSHGG